MTHSGSQAQRPNADPRPITQRQVQEYNQYIDRAKAFWVGQGLEGIGDTSVTFVSGASVDHCGPISTHSGDNSKFCGVDNGISLTADSIHGKAVLFGPVALVGHEFGHAVQWQTDKMRVVFGPSKQRELGATCLSGMFVRVEFPQQVIAGAVLSFVIGSSTFLYGSSETHGTTQQQQDAFMKGFNSQDCTSYGEPAFSRDTKSLPANKSD